MQALTLRFAGPYSWPGTPDAPSLFDAPEADQPGIYLWTVPLPEGHLVYYVGETGRSFATRLREHYLEHAAGMYHLYEPDAFARGEKSMVWPGLWDREDRKTVQECIEAYPQLAPTIAKMTSVLRFFLAPMDCDQRTRKRVEGALARALYEAPGKAGEFQERGIRYERRREDERAIQVKLATAVPLLGVPEELNA